MISPTDATGRGVRGRVLRRLLAAGPLVLMLAMLLAVTAYPIGTILHRAFFDGATLNLGAFRTEWQKPGTGDVLRNTLILIGTSSLSAIVLGSAIAWLNERTDARIGFVANVMPVLPLVMPPIAGAVGWVFLLAPTGGFLNAAIRDVAANFGWTMQTGPIDLYTFPGLIAVSTLYLVPYVYLIISVRLVTYDVSIDEASRVLGRGPVYTALAITARSISPALASSLIVVLIAAFGLFSVAIVVGTPAEVEVLSVRVYRDLNTSYPANIQGAVVLSTLMLAIVQLSLLAQLILRRGDRFAAIGGKGIRRTPLRLARARRPAQAFLVAFLLTSVVLPFAGLLLVSVQPFWFPEFHPDTWTTENYTRVLRETAQTRKALANSLRLGIAGAVIAMIFSTALALSVRQARNSIKFGTDAIASLPGVVPHTVIGLGFLLSFGREPFGLHGSVWLLLLAYLALYLPQSFRTAEVALSSIGNEAVEAGRVSGGGRLRVFLLVLLPLLMPGLVAGFIIVFVLMVNELTASALLASSKTPVVGFVILDLWENGTFPQIAALAATVSLVNTVVVIAAFRIRSLATRGYSP